MTAIDDTNEAVEPSEPQKLDGDFIQAVDATRAEIASEKAKKKPRAKKVAGAKEPTASAAPKPNGGNGKTKKSVAKEIEDLKAEAAPTADLLNRSPQVPAFDQYDYSAEAMVTDQNYRDGEYDTTVGEIPVGKPGKQEWFRIHPEFHRCPVCLLEERDEETDIVEHVYYVPPPLTKPLSMDVKIEKSLIDYRLYVMTNTEGHLKVWIIKMPDKDGKISSWARSERVVAEAGKVGWVRRLSAKTGYNIGHPTATSKLLTQAPIWHDSLSFNDILKIAFRDFTIDSLDHPVLKKLRGEV